MDKVYAARQQIDHYGYHMLRETDTLMNMKRRGVISEQERASQVLQMDKQWCELVAYHDSISDITWEDLYES